jgi:hypothetical protein
MMSLRVVLCFSALCALVAAAALPVVASAAPPDRTLRNDRVGYTLTYPGTWRLATQVVATQFATGGACQSVRVVDDAGTAEVHHSFVQICSRRLTDGSSLAGFMRSTYGGGLSKLFVATRLGGMPAYRTRTGPDNRTFFVQANGYRLQLVAAVATRPSLRAKRLAQLAGILASFSLKRL